MTPLIVHCPTQEDYDQLMKVCEELGYRWCDSARPTDSPGTWNHLEKFTGILVRKEELSLQNTKYRKSISLAEALKILKN